MYTVTTVYGKVIAVNRTCTNAYITNMVTDDCIVAV